MLDAEIGKSYIFVRQIGGAIERAEFVRCDDGSAVVDSPAGIAIYECCDDAWELALAELLSQGFALELLPKS